MSDTTEQFVIRPATRAKLIPLIGFFGESGGGKTLSALYLMRGLVGPKGKIGFVDTDNRRSEIFSSMIPGGFQVIDLQPPFHPNRIKAAIQSLIDAGCAGIIVDNASAEWEGEGGYLETKYDEALRMAGGEASKTNTYTFAAAGKVKPMHNRFVQFCCRLPVPLIMCFRAKEKVRTEKNEKGWNEVVADGFATPIQEAGFIYEMLISGEVFKRENEKTGDFEGGFLSLRGVGKKHTHADVLKILPKVDGEQISIAHGEALAAWCNSASSPVQAPAAKPAQTTTGTTVKDLKAKLWKALQPVRGTESTWTVAQQWLWDEAFMDPNKIVAELSESELSKLIPRVENKLQEAGNVP